MVSGNEAATVEQFKVWASKQGGGGGGSSKAVTLWEGNAMQTSPGTVDAGRQYRWVVLWIGSDPHTTIPYAVEWGTSSIYAVPQMDGSVNGATLTYSGTTITVMVDAWCAASKLQVADWE